MPRTGSGTLLPSSHYICRNCTPQTRIEWREDDRTAAFIVT
jgi:hypothetical protein